MIKKLLEKITAKILKKDSSRYSSIVVIFTSYYYYNLKNEYYDKVFDDFSIKESLNTITIKITSKNPGIIIGKEGIHIKNAVRNISTYFDKNIEIEFIENRINEKLYFVGF